MNDPTRESLQRAYELLKAGRRTETLKILQQLIMADDTNVDAWWLMANTLENPADRRIALANVLELNPKHGKARKMLAELIERYPKLAQKPNLVTQSLGSPSSSTAPRGRALRVVLILGLVLLALAVLAWLIGSGALI